MEASLISNIVATVAPASFATILAFLFIMIAYYFFKTKDLPPGPTGLPYFGYWPFLNDANCTSKLEGFKKKYGDIFSFTCTGRLYINLGSFKAVREACINKAEFFGNRVSGYNVVNRLFKDGVITINGEKWKAARKFFLVLIKERGANSLKTSLADTLYSSINTTMLDLKAKNGKPVNLIDFLVHECCNVVRMTLFGEIGATQAQIREFNDLYSTEIKCMTPKNLLLCGTFAKYFIFPFMPNFLKSVECHRKMEKIVKDIIEEHKITYDPEVSRDIIDEYFKERDKRLSRGDPTAEHFTDKVLVGSIVQFMGDGALFAASFTTLLMTGMLLFPEEQDKLYKEIVEVIGLDRQPTIEDKSKLTYFNAYVKESIRTADFFSFLDTQECRQETTLGGYRIPKGAVLLQNFYSCHVDPDVYEEPEKFKPSRYIQTNGKKKPEPPIMFGVGKRACIGESFIMMQAFLLLSTIIQNFHLSLPEGEKISIESFVNSKLLVCAKPRGKFCTL